MVRVAFVESGGRRHEVDARDGQSAMEAAVRDGIEGIVAECGGSMICATCHVYVDPLWAEPVGAPSRDEDSTLEGAAAERRPNSRLSCQIELTPALDGLVLHLPDRQY